MIPALIAGLGVTVSKPRASGDDPSCIVQVCQSEG